MPSHHFISYSSVDARDFALRLHKALKGGAPPVGVWLDKRELRPGPDWDEQIAEAIRTCDSLLFVMSRDSIESQSVCKLEWTRALKYKKPIIPILLHDDADIPFRLANREYIDFSGAFAPALARLRKHLRWLASPEGRLQALKDRLADAQRDLRRADDRAQRARIQDDIALLEKQIADQQRVVDDPQAAAQRVAESIARGLERERQPEKPVGGITRSKFINPPPGVAPTYFQDRHVETKLIGDFLQDDGLRLMTVVGRGGTGKTALVCRLLKALESGRLPDDGGPLKVDGIVYLSATGSRRVNMPSLYADLGKLLPDETATHLDTLYKNPQASTQAKMRALLAEFPAGRTVLLLDNFEDLVDPATLAIHDAELDESLRALLDLPQHAVKVIVTTRIAPRALALAHPERQIRLDLDEGLVAPYAENILREMDTDGKIGLRDAPEALLAETRERTRGYPRALEALFAILSADRDTTLHDILSDTARLLPEHVVEVLVGEAFSRLDPAGQQVMQALAVYARPVTPAAVDYLLQPYLPGVNSAPVLGRLVNMQFVRKEAGRYYLHPVDRAYAFGRIPDGEPSDRYLEDAPPFSQFALLHRGAEYFKQARTPRESWNTIDDLAPQLAEFDLRCAGGEYETAAEVLLEIDFDYLLLWSYYRLLAELHERLQGKLDDPKLRDESVGHLGSAYAFMGQTQKAITCQEQALTIARQRKDSRGESVWLGNLGNRYFQLGQTARAIDYYHQGLDIAYGTGERDLEGDNLANLGNCYAQLGQTARAIDYHHQGLAIFREIRDRVGEGHTLCFLAEVLIDEGRYEEAVENALESAKIMSEIGQPSSFPNGYLALARLYSSDLSTARAAAEAARRYDEPRNNHFVLALLGLIALRQADHAAAHEAFAAAMAQADTMLSYSAQNYDALDSKGLALCGLALCEGSRHIPAAIEAYRAARAISRDAGAVGRVLRLFDALAVVDVGGVLTDMRAAAGGADSL